MANLSYPTAIRILGMFNYKISSTQWNKIINVFGKTALCHNGTETRGKIVYTTMPLTICPKNTHPNKLIGIDVPVLITNEKNPKGIIVIIGQDPLRKRNNCGKYILTKVAKDHPTAIIGTPFAIDCQFNIPKQCDVYKQIITQLLNDRFAIYLTDANKAYNISINPAINQSILESEFCDLQDKGVITHVVTFGEKAKLLYQKLGCSSKYGATHLLHPSQRNRANWRKRFPFDTLNTAEDIANKSVEIIKNDIQ